MEDPTPSGLSTLSSIPPHSVLLLQSLWPLSCSSDMLSALLPAPGSISVNVFLPPAGLCRDETSRTLISCPCPLILPGIPHRLTQLVNYHCYCVIYVFFFLRM